MTPLSVIPSVSCFNNRNIIIPLFEKVNGFLISFYIFSEKGVFCTLFAENVIPNCYDYRTRKHPGVGCLCRIIIVYGAAGGVPSVNGIPRRLLRSRSGGDIPVAVSHAGKSAGLINNAGNAVRKGWMLHAVQHNRSNCDLSGITFAPRFGGNHLCQQINIIAAVLGR